MTTLENFFKNLLLWNCWAKWAQIFMAGTWGGPLPSLFKSCWSGDLWGINDHFCAFLLPFWKMSLKIISETAGPNRDQIKQCSRALFVKILLKLFLKQQSSGALRPSGLCFINFFQIFFQNLLWNHLTNHPEILWECTWDGPLPILLKWFWLVHFCMFNEFLKDFLEKTLKTWRHILNCDITSYM